VNPAGNGNAEDYRRYLGLGLNLPIPVLAGALLGYWADGRFGTRPWLLVAGAAVGMVLGFGAFLATALRSEGGKDPRGRT
jgi:F0F1-type ATP synthase assembly protein I